jgi:hypothetical protein
MWWAGKNGRGLPAYAAVAGIGAELRANRLFAATCSS